MRFLFISSRGCLSFFSAYASRRTPCFWLRVATAGPLWDFHPLERAHAEHTQEKSPGRMPTGLYRGKALLSFRDAMAMGGRTLKTGTLRPAVDIMVRPRARFRQASTRTTSQARRQEIPAFALICIHHAQNEPKWKSPEAMPAGLYRKEGLTVPSGMPAMGEADS